MRPARRHRAVAPLVALVLGGLAPSGCAGAVGGSTRGRVHRPRPGSRSSSTSARPAAACRLGCAPPPVANGFDALTRAGFPIRNVSSQPGFLCQIDGKPADDPCTHVPSHRPLLVLLVHAARGGQWTYSSSGASRTPPPGSVEGWAFGAGDPPEHPAARARRARRPRHAQLRPTTTAPRPRRRPDRRRRSSRGDLVDGETTESTAAAVDGDGTTTSTRTGSRRRRRRATATGSRRPPWSRPPLGTTRSAARLRARCSASPRCSVSSARVRSPRASVAGPHHERGE